MLISLETLIDRYDINVSGVLHVGAHLGEEAEVYARLGIPAVWWVEGNPTVLPKLAANLAKWPHQELISALITDVDGGTSEFNITNYDGMSSSVFQFGTHTKDSPDTVFVDTQILPTRTLDSLVEEYNIRVNFLCLDVQGAEMLALRGASKLLPRLDYVYTEVSTGPVYLGGAQMYEIDRFLGDFQRVETDLGMHRGKHGDAFYVRKISYVV